MFTIGNVDGGLIIEVLIKDNNHNLLNYYYRQESAQVVHQPYLISDVFIGTDGTRGKRGQRESSRLLDFYTTNWERPLGTQCIL